MIPRRRIPLEWTDLKEWLVTPWLSPSGAAEAVSGFERAFADYLGVGYARATASGRDALGLILDGLGLSVGDEVVIPAYTLGELLPLLQQRGLRLVPADIDAQSFNVTADSVAASMTPQTRAILVVHLLGAPCDIRGICRLAAQAGIPVIEDCAHAPGARVDGRAVGGFGRAALFSLEATKAVSAYGGGVVATNDTALAAYVDRELAVRPRREWPAMKKALLTWGEELLVRCPLYGIAARILFSDRMAGRFEQAYRGANQRARSRVVAFSGFQARVALRRLRQLDERNRRLNRLWQETAARLPAGLVPQQRDQSGDPAFYNLVARFDGDVRKLRRAAQARGVDLGILGEVMDDTAALLGDGRCARVAQLHAQAVLLPLYAGMTPARLRQWLDALQRAVGAAA